MRQNGCANTAMKTLIRRPFLSGLLLSLPLWVALQNFIVAVSLGMLLSFLISMLASLHQLKQTRQLDDRPRSSSDSRRP